MKNTIYPCLWFDGNAKQAAEFYCSIFNHSKITVDSPMVVTYELCGKKFMGLNGGPLFSFTPAISFFVNCETFEETNEIWTKIGEGGQTMMALDKYPWSNDMAGLKINMGLPGKYH